MDCDKYIEWMSAALDGECTAEERELLDDHLAVCSDCAALYEQLSRNARAARELDCEVPADLKDRILSNLPAQETPAKKGKVIPWKRWVPVAAAACLVLVVSLLPRMGHNVGLSGENAAPEMADSSPGNSSSSEHIGESIADASNQPGHGSLVDPEVENESIARSTYNNEQNYAVNYGATAAPGACVLSSVEELAAYVAQFPNDDLSAVTGAYGEEFFANGRLLMVVVEAASGSYRYEIASEGVTADNVTVLEILPDGELTSDMAAWLLVAEVDRSFDSEDLLDVVIIN